MFAFCLVMSRLNEEIDEKRRNLLSKFCTFSPSGYPKSTFILRTGAMAIFEQRTERSYDSVAYFFQRSLTVANSWPIYIALLVIDSEEEFSITSEGFVNCAEILGHLNHDGVVYSFHLHSPNFLYAIESIKHIGMLILHFFFLNKK